MAQDSIDKVLASRQPSLTVAPAEDGDKFYSVLVGEGVTEHFLELRFRMGMRTCFSYSDLIWFNYDPEGGLIDLEFGGYLITVKGRGFGDVFFNHLKQKRVAWIAEADVEIQDHEGNKVFVQEITITPPSSGGEGEQPAKE